jgi:hypothetical protein
MLPPSRSLVEASVRGQLQSSLVPERVSPRARLLGLNVPAGRVVSCIHAVRHLTAGEESKVSVIGAVHGDIKTQARSHVTVGSGYHRGALVVGVDSSCHVTDADSQIESVMVCAGASLQFSGAAERLRAYGRSVVLGEGTVKINHLVVEPQATVALQGTVGSLHIRSDATCSLQGTVTDYAVIAGAASIRGVAHSITVVEGGRLDINVARDGLHICEGATVALYSHAECPVHLAAGGTLVIKPGAIAPYMGTNNGTIIDQRSLSQEEALQAGDDPVS